MAGESGGTGGTNTTAKGGNAGAPSGGRAGSGSGGRAGAGSSGQAGSGGSKSGGSAGAAGGPDLEVGVWTDISPPVNLVADGTNAGVVAVAYDPSNSQTLYAGVDNDAGEASNGLWKTTDGGKTWTRLKGADTDADDGKTSYLDSSTNIAVDPNDPDHLYATQGVRGSTLGFWISNDGGKSWERPASFMKAFPEGDATALAIDPTDFNHALVGSHSFDNVGVLETKDGGKTWTVHPPQPSWPGGSYGLSFLYHPASGKGDSNTWLVHHDGFWRTTNAGQTWQRVSDIGPVHGFTELYYTASGVIYHGAEGCPARSKDNGLTWEQVGGEELPCNGFNTIIGDGTNLWAQHMSFEGDNPFYTAKESSDSNWSAYRNQVFPGTAIMFRFDPRSRVVYAADGLGGLLALKVP